MNELYLVYINVMNMDWEGNNVYEFIFCDTYEVEKIEGEDWNLYPASNNPTPPNIEYVKAVGQLRTEMDINTIQKSDTFSMYDAVDGVIALGWDDIEQNYDVHPEKRLVFNYGETLESVEKKLYAKDLVLNYTLENEEE